MFEDWLGKGTTIERPPQMGGEDFGRYGRADPKVPICIYWLGVASKETIQRGLQQGGTIPSLHSPLFAPDADNAIRVGVTATTAAMLDLLSKN